MNNSLMSSNNNNWCTPPEVLNLVRNVGSIELDPCGNIYSVVNATRAFFYPQQDGLLLPWGQGLTYCNPPYGRGLIKWAEKAVSEAGKGCEIILLVPSRTDTRWFNIAFRAAQSVCFWKGRIKFLGAPSPAPFPTAIFYYGSNDTKFRLVFQSHGIIVETK